MEMSHRTPPMSFAYSFQWLLLLRSLFCILVSAKKIEITHREYEFGWYWTRQSVKSQQKCKQIDESVASNNKIPKEYVDKRQSVGQRHWKNHSETQKKIENDERRRTCEQDASSWEKERYSFESRLSQCICVCAWPQVNMNIVEFHAVTIKYKSFCEWKR